MDTHTHLLASALLHPVGGHPAWTWGLFAAVVAGLLAADLGLPRGRRGGVAREPGVRESLVRSAAYVAVAMAFAGWLAWRGGQEAGLAFVTAYVMEKSLSIDNVFIIALVFSSLAIPRALQQRVLFWGLLGAVVLRGVLVAAGAAFVARFDWALPVFGAFLVVTGLRLLREPPGAGGTGLLDRLRRVLRVTPALEGQRFVVRRRDPATGRTRWWATPLLLALLAVESADLVFAIDSVPAVFAITTDPFIVYTSNLFAVLGLRALYFALAALLARVRYLHVALAGILVFVGGKTLAAAAGLGHVPAGVSLAVVAVLLAAAGAASAWAPGRGDGQRDASRSPVAGSGRPS